MRVDIPNFEKKSDLFRYLKENKKELISRKKSMAIYSETLKSSPIHIYNKSGNHFSTKVKSDDDIKAEDGAIRVKVVANAHNFIDSYGDVLLQDSPKKSIQERKEFIPHLKDHIHDTSGIVGDVVDITLEDMPVTDLGYKSDGSTQCVVFTTDIIKEYCEKTFLLYKKKKVNQHSIGLQYIKIFLCINSDEPDYTREKEDFDKFYKKVINKEVADELGWFFAVTEYKLIENSVVLFGANQYTPTLSDNNSESEGEKSTENVTLSKSIEEITAEKVEKLKLLENKFKNLLKN